MKAKFFQTEANKKRYDIVSIKLDRYSLDHLKQGLALRAAFYTDDKEHLEWYERECMVVEIGLNINLEEKEKIWSERISQDGVIDKNYLLSSIRQIKDKLFESLTQDFDEMGLIKKRLPADNNIIDVEKKEIVEYIKLPEAAEILRVSGPTVVKFVKQGLMNGQKDEICPGWAFSRKEIEEVLRKRPSFLKRVWKRNNKKLSSKGSQEKVFVGIDMATRILKLTKKEIMNHVHQGKLNAEYKEGINEWFFLKSDLETYIY